MQRTHAFGCSFEPRYLEGVADAQLPIGGAVAVCAPPGLCASTCSVPAVSVSASQTVCKSQSTQSSAHEHGVHEAAGDTGEPLVASMQSRCMKLPPRAAAPPLSTSNAPSTWPTLLPLENTCGAADTQTITQTRDRSGLRFTYICADCVVRSAQGV
jgi:hypothetical protein